MTRWWSILLSCVCCFAQWSAPPFAPESAQLKPADLKEILGLLCPGQEFLGQESGCRVCPQQTGTPGAKSESSIESAIPGHFLEPASDDLLVVLLGCSTRAEIGRSAWLFTHSTSGWFVSKAAGLPAGRCRKIRNRQGRDALLCFIEASSADQSRARVSAGYVGETELALANAFDNTGTACADPAHPAIQSAIQQVSFLPGAAGKLTVRILARCRRGSLSARSRKACASGPGFEDIGPAIPFRTFRIDYAFNGEAFSLAPESRASKQAYETCSAEEK